MDIYLPIAEMPINVLLVLLLGAAGGFLSGLFGVGGGFLLTPLLMFIGVPPSVSVGTQANQLVGTSLAGALAHWKHQNIDVRMGLVMMIGSFTGTAFGVVLFKWLQYIGQINLVITIGYSAILGFIGLSMFVESGAVLLRRSYRRYFKKTKKSGKDSLQKDLVRLWGSDSRTALDFPASRLRVSFLVPAAIGFLGGLMVALLGIGGGFVLIPAMLYVLRMPPQLVSGTSLFQIIFTTAFATILQAVLNQSVDVVLAMTLLAGSVIGVPSGTRMAVRMKPDLARFLLALLILAVAIKLVIDMAMTPEHPFSIEVNQLT